MIRHSGQFVKGTKRQKESARQGGKAVWENMTPELRSAFASKKNFERWAKLTPKERRERSQHLEKMWDGTTPEQRSKMITARVKKISPEKRSKRIAAGWANSTPQQRMLRSIRSRVKKMENGLARLRKRIADIKEEIRVARIQEKSDKQLIKKHNSMVVEAIKREHRLKEALLEKTHMENDNKKPQ